MSEVYDCDLLIIGGGSAGTTAAMTAVGFGRIKVLLVEKGLLGGTCTNVGCVPSKSYLHGVDLARSVMRAKQYGFDVTPPSGGYGIIREHKQRIIDKFRASGQRVLEGAGVEMIHETAVFEGDGIVSVGDRLIRPGHTLIATGASPFIPPINGLDTVPYLTSSEALDMESLPESIIIVGGAYIGLELAGFFNVMGVKTTVIEALDRVAPNEDAEISAWLGKALKEQGIDLVLGAKVKRVAAAGEGVRLNAERDGAEFVLEGAKLLIATGRTPNLDGLNLEAAAVKYGRKGVGVDQFLCTSAPSVYAAGDVVPSLQLEHVGVYEGWLSASNIYSGTRAAADYRVIPRVMFSYPEVASVGETEEQAAGHSEIAITTYSYAGIAMAQINEDPHGFIKLIADAKTGVLLGAHIVGRDAGNLIHLAAMAMKHELPIANVGELVAAYPTLAQGFFYAADDLASP